MLLQYSVMIRENAKSVV